MRALPTHVFLLLLAATPLGSRAQQNEVPLQRDIYLDLERNAARRSSHVHSGLKPLVESRADLTNVMGYRPDSTRHYYWLTEKLFSRHLIDVRHGDVHVTIDPVFQFELGHDFRDPSGYADTVRFFHNARGFLVRADLGEKLSFQTTFYENQALFPQYIYLYTQQQQVVPGQGRIKERIGRVFDFGWAQANLSYSPTQWLNIRFGHGRNFVGHGYRSLLLSDNAFAYPGLTISALSPNGRFQYTTIHSKLNVLDRLPVGAAAENLFYWKRASFHHLSMNLGALQLGIFEGTIWRNIDAEGVRPVAPLQYNPIIGLNTAVHGFDGEVLNLVGLDLRYKLTDRISFHGQLAMDDPSGDRVGWQAGMRWFDLAPELHVQVEYNSVPAFMYTNSPAAQNYVHHGQPLAHPLGTWFDEAVFIVDYRFKRKYLFQARLNLATVATNGSDSANYGADIFLSEIPAEIGDGPVFRTLTGLDLSASWVLNQMTNLRFTVGWMTRELTPAPDQLQTGYLYGAFRTNLFNRYYDF